MSDIAIRVENLGKKYRLGLTHERTLRDLAQRWTRRLLRRPDPAAAPSPLGGEGRGDSQTPAPLGGVGRGEGGSQRLSASTPQRSNVPQPSTLNAQRNGTFWALRDVSFEVKRGEVLGIIGRNGAGKSTLLKILSQITKPTTGRAEIHGRVGSLLEVGTGFHPELTGRENVYLNGTILGMSTRDVDRNFDEIVKFAGVQDFMDTPVKRYSSGMKVRLGFAVAAHLEPEILIVDEVLSVGDTDFQKRCLGKINEVTGCGRTVVFVSHNMVAVKSLCRRLILLDEGRVKMIGDTGPVLECYLMNGSQRIVDGLIPNDAERIGTGEARIRRVQLLNRDGLPVTELMLGQSFRVRYEFDAIVEITDLHFGISISTKDGITLTTSQTTDRRAKSSSASVGHHVVEATFDVVLTPGRYTLDLGLHRENGASIDFVANALDFTVLRVAEGNDAHYRWNRVIGYIRPNVSWNRPRSTAIPKDQFA